MKSTYSPEVRAAVLSDLLAGQAVGVVAAKYKIHRNTVMAWRNAAGISPQVSEVSRAELGELVAQYLRANLEALITVCSAASNKNWLHKQSAEGISVLHGIFLDKAVRLLEAVSSEPDPTDDPAGADEEEEI
jgi:transposase-like protein